MERKNFVLTTSPFRRMNMETLLIPLDRGFVGATVCIDLGELYYGRINYRSTHSYHVWSWSRGWVQKSQKVQKLVKITYFGGFSPRRDDSMNWSRWNSASKSISLVYFHTQNLALVGGEGIGTGAPKVEHLAKYRGFYCAPHCKRY